MSLSSRSPTDGAGAPSSLSSSAAIRSPDRWPTSSARAWIPASVAASTAEPERRREPDGPDHPERVLLEPGARVADRAEHAGDARRRARRTGPTNAGRFARSRAPGHRVDREVAARQVELDGVAELDAVRSPEVGVVVVGPEGRDLEDLAVAPDGDGPEPVLVDGAREELDEPFG